MEVFPQLSSGSVAQFPIQSGVTFRTIGNRLSDGSTVSFGDVGFEQRVWELRYADLSDGEIEALVGLFDRCEGRLKTFVFLDPLANLLSWSSDLTVSSWTKTGVEVVSGATPAGQGAGFSVRGTSGPGVIRQDLSVPASFTYAASAWVRASDDGGGLRMIGGGTNAVEVEIGADGRWRRYQVRSDGLGVGDTVGFELTTPSSGSIDVFGPQMEAQAVASAYKATRSRGGVFEDCRFDQDDLEDKQTGPGAHSTVVRVLWKPSLK